jgi:uncharacterized membrane protein
MTDATTPPPETGSQLSQQEIDSGKTMAILAYIPIVFIGLIVSIVSISSKNNAFALYHAKQALTLYICWIVVALCCLPLCIICIGVPLLIATNICGIIFCVLGIINASSNQCKPLPVIAQFAERMNNSKNTGIALVVIGGAIGLWVFIRMTSLAGKLATWSPPFSQYETYTIVGAVVAVLFLIVGIRKVSEKN